MVDTHRNTRIRDLARRTLVGATLVVLAMIGLVATATPAAAADGLDIEASYVYRLGDDGVLRVEATYTLTNVTANTVARRLVRSWRDPGRRARSPGPRAVRPR